MNPSLTVNASVRLPESKRSSSAIRWGQGLTILILITWILGVVLGFQFSLQVLTVVGFLAAIAGLRSTSLGLLGVSMLCTLDTISRPLVTNLGFWRYNSFNYLLIVVLVLSIPTFLKFRDPHSRILQVFIALLGLEILVGSEWRSGLDHLLNIATMFGVLIYFYRANEVKTCWYPIGLVNGTMAATGCLLFYLQKTPPELNKNALAYFPLSAIFAICLSSRFLETNLRRQVILGSLALVNYLWVFLSGSRGGLIVATVSIIFLLITGSRLSMRLVYALILVVVAMASSIIFSDLNGRSIFRLTGLTDSDRSVISRTSGRSDLALAAWYMFLDHPLGVGTGGFAATRIGGGYVKRTSGWENDTQMEAHAGWMKTLAENGIPGILLQAAYVLSFALIGWQKRREGLFSIGLLVSLTLGLAFITTEMQTKGLWFLAAGAVVLLHNKRASRTPELYHRKLLGPRAPARLAHVRPRFGPKPAATAVFK